MPATLPVCQFLCCAGVTVSSPPPGDARLGTMETGSAIVRAMSHLMTCRDRYQVDLINMSYGEHARWSDSGYQLAAAVALFPWKHYLFIEAFTLKH